MHQPHFPSEIRTRVRPVALELAQHRLDDLRRLVLAHLPLGDDPGRDQAQPDRAAAVAAGVLGDLGRGVERARIGDVLLEVLDETGQDLEVLLRPRTSGTPERCATMKFHVGTSMWSPYQLEEM